MAKKNSVGQAVAVLLISIRKKAEVMSSEELSSYACKNSEESITKIEKAVQWCGTADSLSERLKKVFSSCILDEKKRPKILTELNVTNEELYLISSMIKALKSSSIINIQTVDI